MQLQIGSIVRATAGKEQNHFYIVTKIETGFVYLADGKHRALEQPKRKNLKHVCLTNTVWQLANMSNKALRQRLYAYETKSSR